ncbi:hypothetical protein FHG87_020925 [Trinorchestia longiramus]|nr:hypothetical protein FHG87_020925 [Trinorchestia longiramus]
MNTNSTRSHVTKPTERNNILDLVMTTPHLIINGLEVTGKIDYHQMIDFKLEVRDLNTSTQQKQVLDYKPVNFELIKKELCNINDEVPMRNKNAEKCYMILKEKITTAPEYNIITNPMRPPNHPPWLSQEIKRIINDRHQSYRSLQTFSAIT